MKHLRIPRLAAVLALAAACLFAICGCSSGNGGDGGSQQGSQQLAESSAAADVNAHNAVFDEEALVNEYVSAFEQKTYEDSESGKSITYNLYLPEGYDAQKSYPMVVFIADSSCTGDDATRSLSQGLGGLVWASADMQAENECIVCVPTYPETILDDHDSYTTTDYVEATKRLIDAVSDEYAVDKGRIYGTGQSMGCMTTLILASEYPDLYAACMFVDGQWDVSTLKGLEGQKFVYFAAEDDESAYSGMKDVMSMFDDDKAAYTYKQWDGTWSGDELATAAAELFAGDTDANFISWKTGTIETSGAFGGGHMGGGPANGQRPDGAKPDDSANGQRPDGAKTDDSGNGGNPPQGNGPQGGKGGAEGGNGGPQGNGGAPVNGGPQGGGASDGSAGAGNGDASGKQGGPGGGAGMGGAGVHMASFDYAYNCKAVMEWLFGQSA